jgi:lipopolysaccharide/colanic/teichoic acid biosynthesis glycosyltransferase
VLPHSYERAISAPKLGHGDLPRGAVSISRTRGWSYKVKHGLDWTGALTLLVILAPVYLMCSIAVLVSLGRPIHFRQTRVGADGRLFTMLKFRTLPYEPEQETADVHRDVAPGGVIGVSLTRVGRLLRRTSLDELPQLLNVLRGEMSLVGPRPERPKYVHVFEGAVRGYGDRHRVRPGITGWAQIHGLRGQTSLRDRVAWDNFYIDNWSLRRDLSILLRTVAVVVRLGGE